MDESSLPQALRQNQCTKTYDEVRAMKNKDGNYVCLWFAARGTCVAGDNCKWSHDDSFKDALTQKQKGHIISEQDRQARVRKWNQEHQGKAKANAKAKADPPKPKPKPNPKGTAAPAPTKVDSTKLSAEEKAKIPCIFWGTAAGCTRWGELSLLPQSQAAEQGRRSHPVSCPCWRPLTWGAHE